MACLWLAAAGLTKADVWNTGSLATMVGRLAALRGRKTLIRAGFDRPRSAPALAGGGSRPIMRIERTGMGGWIIFNFTSRGRSPALPNLIRKNRQ